MGVENLFKEMVQNISTPALTAWQFQISVTILYFV